MLRRFCLTLLLVLLGGGAAAADEAAIQRFAAACRADIARLCPGTAGEGLAACLQSRVQVLSPGCSAAAAALGGASTQPGANGGLPRGTRILRNESYGHDREQRMDVFIPPDADGAPILLYVHGGGWAGGDKEDAAGLVAKLRHWLPRGYILVSMNHRRHPRADPLRQAEDVGKAIAAVQRQAAEWGGDGDRIVPMGHSSGGHLVALIAAEPGIARRQGARKWLGTVVLDAAVLDVPARMAARHERAFDAIFGSSLVGWQAVSPVHRMSGTPQPLLLVCSTARRTSCGSAKAFALRAKGFHGRATVLPTALKHNELNEALGEDAKLTAGVDTFLASLGLP